MCPVDKSHRGRVRLASFVDSFKRFAIVLAFVIVLGLSTIYLFDVFVAQPINLPVFLRQSFRIIFILGFWLLVLFLLQRSKPLLTAHLGAKAATVMLYLMGAVAVLVMSFGVLHTLGVSPENLLAGAGIISIVVGLVISTFVGGVLSGLLVFTSHRFRMGDSVLVNNIPGKVTDITALVTRVRTDVGQMSIPNSAIASGAVIVTAVHKYEAKSQSRLPYDVGDRVVTTYMNGEGIVKELTPLHTVILLDSGRELTFLNNSILSGSVAVAKVTQVKGASKSDKKEG